MPFSKPLLVIIVFFLASFTVAQDYVQSIEEWRRRRVERLTQPDGWLSLIGLFWLEGQENTVGSDAANDIRFPADRADASLGVITVADGVVTMTVNAGADVRCNGEPVTGIVLETDKTGAPTVLTHRTLMWHIIDRDGRLGVRLKDSQSERLRQFAGIDCFPIDEKWAVEARFEPADSAKRIAVTNVMGKVTQEPSPGTLVFTIDGAEYRLDTLEGGDQYFVVFGDRTNGEESYGGGRFLYVDGADDAGRTIIDFNKAYNPPCAFTPFATCPLPPRQNILPISVTAGEKTYGRH